MATQAFLKSLTKGQILHSVVEEKQSGVDVLCNFQGSLLRIVNHTGQPMEKGQSVRLQVKCTDPLEFQIFDPNLIKFERVI
ncbi:hypothetical protein [Bdellovibrio sp. HCB209]|uniref:hypothetical protein n=1 Tax=Bdellovibrio sp. HCB209 TaxID=3394354 RepID=UPI0039B5B5C4